MSTTSNAYQKTAPPRPRLSRRRAAPGLSRVEVRRVRVSAASHHKGKSRPRICKPIVHEPDFEAMKPKTNHQAQLSRSAPRANPYTQLYKEKSPSHAAVSRGFLIGDHVRILDRDGKPTTGQVGVITSLIQTMDPNREPLYRVASECGLEAGYPASRLELDLDSKLLPDDCIDELLGR